jgi:CheY-like chemotaxis protein
VLVVEDDESTALFVTRVLSRNGFDAAWVTDAEQASERLDRELFDVLLADCRLPGRNGMDLARDTRQAQPGMGIAVMTSFAENQTEEVARSNGADDFFEKPLHISNFVARIGDLVTRSRTSGSQAESPSARGSQAGPMESAPEASPRSGASGPPNVAEGGSDERAVPRDTAFAQLDVAVADGVAQPRHEGTADDCRTRFSAQFDPQDREGAGCDGWRDASQREEAGRADRDLLARVAHPALSYLIAQRIAAQRAVEPVLMWASGAPAVSIGSHAGRVTSPRTRPGWSLAAS